MEAHTNRFLYGDTKTIVFSLLFLLFISFYSCAGVPKYVQNAFCYCHSEKDIGIDSLINIDGYYYISYPDTGILKGGGHSFMFYRNGLYKTLLPAKYDSIKKQYDISFGLLEIVENTNKEASKWFYLGTWGNYTICKDTIKVQYIDKPMPLTTISAREEWYKIIDRNTLIFINSMPLSTDKSDWQNYDNYKYIRDEKAKYPAIFIPVPIKPNPDDSWILKEKWFWCNESDWKNYMEKIKQKKKQ